jgi:predicted dehydrogenase
MSEQKTVRVALAGLGGYGGNYFEHTMAGEGMELVAVIDPYAKKAKSWSELQAAGIPVYDTLSEFLAADSADLIAISAPIHLHKDMTCEALASGASVICEKPVAGTIQDALAMVRAADDAPGFCAVGYQWSYSDAIQALKADILSGVLGKPIRLKTAIFWPRTQTYYNRNGWAGRIALDGGEYVLDSPANNATAHYFHNMLYVLGATLGTSAVPTSVQAELYRVNPIENYDTAMLRCQMDCGAEVLFYTTHACQTNQGPDSIFEFENGTVRYIESEGAAFVAEFNDGTTKVYGAPGDQHHMDKLRLCVEAIGSGAPVACPVEASIAQILCINGAQESAEITEFPENVVRIDTPDGEELRWIDGLYETMRACFDANKLPSELGGISWAKPGEVVDLKGYEMFPSKG